jgi:hypothetical protein
LVRVAETPWRAWRPFQSSTSFAFQQPALANKLLNPRVDLLNHPSAGATQFDGCGMLTLGDELISRGSPKARALKHLFDADKTKSLTFGGGARLHGVAFFHGQPSTAKAASIKASVEFRWPTWTGRLGAT